MSKRSPNIIGPLAVRGSWLERLLPQRHLQGTTAEERARAAYTMGLLLFSTLASAMFSIWGLLDATTPMPVDVVNLSALVCYSSNLFLFYRLGRRPWVAPLLALQMGMLLVATVATGGHLAFFLWFIAPPLLLMFLVSLRSAYLGTVVSVVTVMVLGILKEREVLPDVQPAGFLATFGLECMAINLWILGNVPLMLVFESRRSWAASEAHLITRVLMNAKEQTRVLLERLNEQLMAILDEPELHASVRESLQEAETSAQRLRTVMGKLAQIAEQEPAAASALQQQLEDIGDDAQERSVASARQTRFMLRVSLLFLSICCVLLPVVLLLKGPSDPMSWVIISALVVFLPNLVLVRRRLDPRLTISWISLQVVALCMFAALVTGDLINASYISLVPIVLLYVIGARWALFSTGLLVVLVTLLAVLLQADYGLPPGAPLSGSPHLDRAGFSGLFVVTVILMFGYFERDRLRMTSVMTLRSSALATLSHELRTPLNGIMGTLSLVREDLPAVGALSGHLSLAERYGSQLSSLVEDALSLAVLSGGRVERQIVSFQLQELCVWLQEEALQLSDKHLIDIDVSAPETSPEQLSGELERLKQTLGSLLEWACEHRPGQSIMMRLQTQPMSRRWYRLEVALIDNDRSVNDDRLGGLADLFVSDHGGRDRNALRVALCRAQVDFLRGRLEAFEKISRGLLLSVPLKLGTPVKTG